MTSDEEKYARMAENLKNLKLFKGQFQTFISVMPANYINIKAVISFLGEVELSVIYGERDLRILEERINEAVHSTAS